MLWQAFKTNTVNNKPQTDSTHRTAADHTHGATADHTHGAAAD